MPRNNSGTITQIIGAVVDVHFEGELPAILNALHVDDAGRTAGARSGPASRREHACARSRWTPPTGWCAATEVVDTGEPIMMPVGPETLGRILNVIGEPVDERGPVQTNRRSPIHRAAPRLHRPVDRGRDPGHRHQGRRSADALRQGRQDRPVRRRRGRQDRDHHGADQQHRQGAWRLLGVRRGRRAHPRRQRPLSRDDRVGGHHRRRAGLQGGARLRPDERAARGARPRRPVGPDRRRIFPRRGRPGRAVLRRQHLPLHPGGLRGVGAAGPHPVGGRLSADAGDRFGDAARSASPAPRRARSPRCRRSTCRPTI